MEFNEDARMALTSQGHIVNMDDDDEEGRAWIQALKGKGNPIVTLPNGDRGILMDKDDQKEYQVCSDYDRGYIGPEEAYQLLGVKTHEEFLTIYREYFN